MPASTPRLVEVKALPAHRLWLRYDDGATGEADLSSSVGRGVFRPVLWEAGLAAADPSGLPRFQGGPFGDLSQHTQGSGLEVICGR